MTVEQFMRKLERVAKDAKWTLDENKRLRANQHSCPIEFVFPELKGNAFVAYTKKLLTELDVDRIVNAADNGNWRPTLPYKELRARMLKAVGL